MEEHELIKDIFVVASVFVLYSMTLFDLHDSIWYNGLAYKYRCLDSRRLQDDDGS